MSSRKPPWPAVWLLSRFRLLARNEALAGDLIEEFHSGRTAGWFWRQTLSAIRAEIGRAARSTNVQALFLAYGITVPPILGFLLIYGRVHIQPSPTAVLGVLTFLATLFWVNAKFRLPGYWGKVVDRCGDVLSKNCVILLLFGMKAEGRASPQEMLFTNILFFGVDLVGAFLLMRIRARRGSAGRL